MPERNHECLEDKIVTHGNPSLVQFAGLLVVGPFGVYCLAARPHVLLSVTLSQTRRVC